MKETILYLTPFISSGLMIIIQYYIIYQLQKGTMQAEESSVSIGAPFAVYTYFIPKWYLPVSFFLSLLLPLYAMIAYREILKYTPFLYSLALTILGIIISATVIETGSRMYHGNFMWQNVVCCHLLFLSTTAFLAPIILAKKSWSKKDLILITFLILHVFSGALYLIKIGTTNSYY
ncbi:MAG: hypothetical protein K1X92_00870 [Bacteroidia bacterium]|nr:hypothetical protein [Bacteroidia bacterium]